MEVICMLFEFKNLIEKWFRNMRNRLGYHSHLHKALLLSLQEFYLLNSHQSNSPYLSTQVSRNFHSWHLVSLKWCFKKSEKWQIDQSYHQLPFSWIQMHHSFHHPLELTQLKNLRHLYVIHQSCNFYSNKNMCRLVLTHFLLWTQISNLPHHFM